VLPACGLLLFLACAPHAARALELSDDQLRIYYDALVDTGVGANSIPPVFQPTFDTVSDAALVLEPNDDVFVLERGKTVRIYPRSVLVWHCIVNDRIDGERVTITYSPLTGSVMGFPGRVGLHDTVFGNTGKLLYADLVLFDYATNSLWAQIPALAIDGALKGTRLTPFALTWTTWGKARRAYPDARVLSRHTGTGVRRPYGKDPYGSYRDPQGYYNNDRITYPLPHRDDRLPPKTPVLALDLEAAPLAVVKEAVRRAGTLEIDAGVTPLVAVWDADLDAVRVFDRRVQGKPLSFTLYEGKLYDRETNSEWTGRGVCTYGMLRDERLAPVDAFDVMWFAWAAFHPDTMLFK
jgi:hypothetical protein